MDRRGFGEVELLGLFLGEIADLELARAAQGAGERAQPPGQQAQQRGLAVAVGAEHGDAVVHVDAQVQIAQHGDLVVAHTPPPRG